MAETLGGVNLLASGGQGNYGGEIPYSRDPRWSVAEPLGYIGRIRTTMGVSPKVISMVRMLTSTSYLAVLTLAEAAYNSGTTHTYVNTEGDMGITSMTVLITKFLPKKSAATRGTTRWLCEIELEEQP